MKNVNLLIALVLSLTLTLSACGDKNDTSATPTNSDNSSKGKDSFKQNPPCYPHCTAGDILNPHK